MSIKLRIRDLALASGAFFALSACSAEPLTPEEEGTIKYVYMTLPDHQALAIKQNLRLTGLYSGELNADYTTELAEAINQVHFDLDLVEDRFQLDTEAGAAGFLQELASSSIRPSLINDLSVSPAEFAQIRPPGDTVERDGRECSIDGGSYSRNGEVVNLAFYKVNGQAGIELYWDGWPSSVFPQLLPVKFGDKTLPMMVSYERHGSAINADIFNVNGFWVTDALKQADGLEIGPETKIAPLELPTGSLYQIGLALEGC
ncbi:MAG: hypothetical protein R3E02_04250 [Blastomonas sp.]